MNAAFRLFRDILPFRQQMAEKESADARELLDTVVGLSASEVAVQLTSHVIPTVVEQRNLTMRFKLLEDTRQEAETALPVLERHVDSSVLPLPRTVRSSALAADNLLKALAAAYFDIAKAIGKSGHQRGYVHLLQRTVNRAMLLIARRQNLAYSSYTSPSSTSWLMLHELYQIVRDLRAVHPETNITPLEQQYLSTLLFAYIDPSKLQRHELTVAIFCTQQLAVHAAIVKVTPDTPTCKASSPCFLVRPEEGSPGWPLLRLPKETPTLGGFIVDCAVVLEALNKSAEHADYGYSDPGLDIPPSLLQTFQHAIGSQSIRRFSRMRFSPRAHVVCGISQVISFLEGNPVSRRVADLAGRTEQRDFSHSEWSLIDQSPDGFLVRFLQGDQCQVGVGNIIALRPREARDVHVCLVRRIAVSEDGKVELGVQALSPKVSVIRLPGHGEIRRGIYLHSLPAFNNRPGIIAHPGYLASGHKIKFELQESNHLLQVGRRLEASEGLEFFALVPL
jgi:cyclic-di-GMP-binding protein